MEFWTKWGKRLYQGTFLVCKRIQSFHSWVCGQGSAGASPSHSDPQKTSPDGSGHALLLAILLGVMFCTPHASAGVSVTIHSGKLTLENGAMYLGGDWTNNSQFDAKGGAVVFNARGVQTITSSSGEETFKNLIVCVEGDLRLNNNVFVTNELIFIQGLVLTGAHALSLRGDHKGALAILEAAVLEDPEDPGPYLRAAMISLQELGNYQLAVEWYSRARRAARMDPEMGAYVSVRLADIHESHGEAGSAMVELRRLVTLYPKSKYVPLARRRLEQFKARERNPGED